MHLICFAQNLREGVGMSKIAQMQKTLKEPLTSCNIYPSGVLDPTTVSD